LKPFLYGRALRRPDRDGLLQNAGGCVLKQLARLWRVVKVNDLGAAAGGIRAAVSSKSHAQRRAPHLQWAAER
jgi:hypothetical protein